MSGWDGHLRALRGHLIRSALVYAALFAATVAWLPVLVRYAMRPVHELHLALIVTSLDEVVVQDLKLALSLAFFAGLPYFLFEAWRFVAPALTASERRLVRAGLAAGLLLFAAGAAFAWWIVVPRLVRYLVAIAAWSHLGVYLRYGSYLSFVSTIVVAFGIAFELPVVVACGSAVGLITPSALRAKRKYAYFALVVVGVLISPPELIAHLTVTVPLFALYEASVAIASAIHRRKSRDTAQATALSER
ncbi:twin-arginine translocase subunit TatC [Alicyclobacillus acidocaldarius]|uniref:Sec-independent protein translocase protein TatC n=1 Tax=Alicyclobacillus acidocaldarius subsp. acidocaldarius (strain ATCC 27009 / DSM 446 / BCRC 14685 / JCM 5260 / KCTC 1825 / NBRC 15652 / NCIMB 11725 / NRRL B-14509 / 104-IA) TaxID=521098 RepID=C8WRE5_ALIAD|nr:twin-arginine translocase subunit TatC [Alicyclobacillus acidocaldarius]ACV57350.1 Sec-independent protein translocase, TatC subunit [Alicyclobacillus acidocaldarius subsp. acidocaldarius DSM 446]